MIWLSALSLVAGALLAPHFKIIVLAPASFLIVVMSIAAGEAYATDIWSIVFTMTIAIVGIQIGYFLGILIQHASRTLLVRRAPPSSDNTTARPPSIFRTPISR